ncbi:MAG TPA: hypothetical protein PKX21_02110, partial [Candidatus Pacearchaeota archaeon]|nr:hypothetical protein [Candidatus Pacearchaeota archaeon]
PLFSKSQKGRNTLTVSKAAFDMEEVLALKFGQSDYWGTAGIHLGSFSRADSVFCRPILVAPKSV